MNQRADADIVHTGRCIVTYIFKIDATAGLGFNFFMNQRQRFLEQHRIKIIQHDPVCLT